MRGWVVFLTACSFSPPTVGGDEDAALVRFADAPTIADAILVDGRPDATPMADANGVTGADGGCAPRAATELCDEVIDLGSVSGDTGAGLLSAHGHGSASFRVEVTEDDFAPIASDPLAEIVLESPPGADFDLKVFCFGSCGGTPIASSDHPAGEADSVGVGQTDQLAEDNGFRLWIDVRFYSGSDCGEWKLKVRGNQATAPVSCY